VISVLVAAASPVVRAGLKTLVEQMPGCAVTGSSGSAQLAERAVELNPGVVLWHVAPDEDAASGLVDLAHYPVLLLTANAPLEMLRAGARGVLPPNASERRIAAALHATASDLLVMAPEGLSGPAVPHAASGLTARETEVLRMIADGLANKEIAWRLGISEHTVKFHVSALLGKLGAASRAEAIGLGIRQGAILL
jgi:DNA-binding NarL/FixJ family response regulator